MYLFGTLCSANTGFMARATGRQAQVGKNNSHPQPASLLLSASVSPFIRKANHYVSQAWADYNTRDLEVFVVLWLNNIPLY